MRLIGFNFTKINVERLKGSANELKIENNIDIIDIVKTKVDFFKAKEDFLVVKFKYIINYSPDFAKLEFEGNIILSDEPKKVKEIIKNWENKEIEEDVRIFIFNLVLQKSNIKALELEEELNLPLHIPMPKLSKQKKEK